MIKINKDLYRNNVVEYAYTFLNKKYVWGARGPDIFDCSGFTWYIYKMLFKINIEENGYGEGDTTKQMTSNVGLIKEYLESDPNKKEYIKDISPGDILFFHRQSLNETTPKPTNRYPGHVGIYIGNNKFIHASSDEEKIIISNLDEYWTNILVASKDIITDIIRY